eukprot:CAMPEP_0171466912 /NCGR_PEP_ID=MMETSP0945-20130129/9605_1 /TAXON_ID=109269 /ORGANISM="Vaucheria litorea, Strain CCMP2940" /LENGTH=150 /DNA_ID=CAMNT_0011995223 /DNA_START=291 /DNA_END=743 /DNA_ORIENTATION=+
MALGGAAGGFIVAGPPGAVAGYFLGAIGTDATTGGGVIKLSKEVLNAKEIDRSGKVFDLTVVLALDALGAFGTANMYLDTVGVDGFDGIVNIDGTDGLNHKADIFIDKMANSDAPIKMIEVDPKTGFLQEVEVVFFPNPLARSSGQRFKV